MTPAIAATFALAVAACRDLGLSPWVQGKRPRGRDGRFVGVGE